MTDQEKTLTKSESIWESIKNVDLGLFALPDQLVSKFFSPLQVETDRLYLVCNTGSALPLLEEIMRDKLSFETEGKYIIVSEKSKAINGR
jgi:hypothetical protein